ncbi:MAG: tRNA uridine-5-carboxymethylaminomethyl(34) synthesis GTPase MnmE, partial [Bacteroidota bacterium]
DLVVYLFDANETNIEELRGIEAEFKLLSKKYLLVGNKIDDKDVLHKLNTVIDQQILYISAKHDLRIDLLKKKLTDAVLQGKLNTEQTIVTNARHYQSLQKLADVILAVKKGMQENLPGDLLAIDIRQCLYHLGEITGAISNEDQLDYIFSKFCIGK